MLEPSYSQIMTKLNEDKEAIVVTSRYSIIIAVARRARQIIDEGNGESIEGKKPIARAVDELYTGRIKLREQKNQ